MKVGLVCPYSFNRPGGVQNHVLGLAGWLKTKGHRVSVLAPGFPPKGMLADYGLTPTEYTTGGKAVPFKVNESVARINFGFGPAHKAKAWLDAGDFDVVHLHEPIAPNLGLLTLWLTDRPVTATFHSNSPTIKTWKRINEMLPGAVHRLDATIAVSSVAAKVARNHTGVVPVVIGNGLAIDDYELKQTPGRWRGGDHPRVAFLGRYAEPRKGFNVLTASLPLVREYFPDLEVIVMGHGPEMSIEGVRFVGGVSDAERNRWLGVSDVYVAPQTGRESFGIVLIEALACGAPVVASNLSAFVEVLTDREGVVGHTFRTGNSHALANAIITSLNEPRDLRLERGRAQAAAFDWSVIGPQVVAMYEIAAENRYLAVDKPKGRMRRGAR
ncbi:glycosyltransferase family 4 protein [Propionimicrobium sp. PCR01-08-3]|uniref:glycosyltransferase family 4 protein n=1 Tax=Propionimicrobium sp. PCR01-08-3 TaxID=3052086 RepID=UPI00255CFA34|nr:glycosyltransferase family 4 protein [Propionimicrobium sp. PCR01-08-3]WIY84068.1 glycosyltransferase family 4 protein [Propionimicrobium sp. PCR01-08-3]